MRAYLWLLTVWVLHLKHGIQGCPQTTLPADILLKELSSQSLVWATSSWSKEQVCNWDIENDLSTYQPGQPRAIPQMPHSCRHAHLVLASGRAPTRPWEVLATIIDIKKKEEEKSPMQTVSRISGMSLPMPAHLVLMSSLQSLRSDDELLQKSVCIQPTQSSRQPSPSLSPPLCCHHWASQCGRGRSQAYQEAPPYPWPIQLMIHINDKYICNIAQQLVFNQSHSLTYSQILLPMISAVSFLSTNIWTLIMAALSAKSGRTKARSLSMCPERVNRRRIILNNVNKMSISKSTIASDIA